MPTAAAASVTGNTSFQSLRRTCQSEACMCNAQSAVAIRARFDAIGQVICDKLLRSNLNSIRQLRSSWLLGGVFKS